jgi:hypothetical protein
LDALFNTRIRAYNRSSMYDFISVYEVFCPTVRTSWLLNDHEESNTLHHTGIDDGDDDDDGDNNNDEDDYNNEDDDYSTAMKSPIFFIT